MRALSVFGVILLLSNMSFAEGVCDRTPEVVLSLTESLKKSCQAITSNDLAIIEDLKFRTPISFKSGDFQGLTGLTDLELFAKGELIPDLLADLPNLTNLTLGAPETANYPDGLFSANQNLLRLELWRETKSSPIKLPKNLFQGLSNLQMLDLSLNNISELPEGIFQDLKQLKTLYLSYNNIPNPSVKLFLNLMELKTLYWSNCQITNLPPNIFSRLSKLQILDISNNIIKTVDPELFSNLKNLKTLYIDYETTSPELFLKTSMLQSLNTYSSRMDLIPEQYLKPFPYITYASFHKKGPATEKDSVNENIFNYTIFLRQIQIHGFDLSTLPASLLAKVPSVFNVSLSKNNLKSLPSGFFKNVFNNTQYTNTLNMSENAFDNDEKQKIIHELPTHIQIFWY